MGCNLKLVNEWAAMLTLFIGLIWIGGAALSSNVVETIQPVAAAIVSAHQFELVDLEFVREGQSWYLRYTLTNRAALILKNVQWLVMNLVKS